MGLQGVWTQRQGAENKPAEHDRGKCPAADPSICHTDFCGSVFQQVYSVVDTMVAGHVLGDGAIAAIGATSTLYGLIILISLGLAGGFVLVITRCFGAGQPFRLRKALATTFTLGGIIALLMTGISVTFLKPFMRMLNTPDSIFEQAHSYMIIICGGLPATVGYNLFAGIMRAFGNSRTPLYALIFSCLLNIGLDVLFVAGAGMGVAGAALATVLAQLVSGVICGAYVLQHYREYLPKGMDFKPDRPMIREMLSSGSAMAFMYSIVGIGSLFYQGAVNALGDVFIAAQTASDRFFMLLMGPITTLVEATGTFVGQNIGAGRRDRVREAIAKALVAETLLGVVGCAITWLFVTPILRLMIGTGNADILYWGSYNLKVMSPFFPVLGVLVILRTSMQAMGQKLAPVISSVTELFLRFLGGIWMIPTFGYPGGAWNTPITWCSMTAFIFSV